MIEQQLQNYNKDIKEYGKNQERGKTRYARQLIQQDHA